MSRWLLVGVFLGVLALPVLFAALATGGLAAGVLVVVLVAAAGGLVGLTDNEGTICHRCGAGNDADRTVCIECSRPL